MDVLFRTRKLARQCNSQTECRKAYGTRNGDLILQRLNELRAAEVLADVSHLTPQRCHELRADRKGQLSVDVAQPYRLIFEPAEEPVPRTADGGLDWGRVRAVRILEVTDTHE